MAMEFERFEIGDTVQLKSGGVKMTIHNTRQGGSEVNCIWSDKDDVVHKEWIRAGVLKKVTPA